MVESDDPAWSVNAKKAVASVLQLDVTGVRSGADGGVFGERSSTLNSLEVMRSAHNEIPELALMSVPDNKRTA